MFPEFRATLSVLTCSVKPQELLVCEVNKLISTLHGIDPLHAHALLRLDLDKLATWCDSELATALHSVSYMLSEPVSLPISEGGS